MKNAKFFSITLLLSITCAGSMHGFNQGNSNQRPSHTHSSSTMRTRAELDAERARELAEEQEKREYARAREKAQRIAQLQAQYAQQYTQESATAEANWANYLGNLAIPETNPPQCHDQKQTPKKQVTKACTICLDSKAVQNFATLSCGHPYCKPCLKEMVKTNMTSKNISALICPDQNCRKPMEREDIQTIAGDNEETLKKFDDLANKRAIAQMAGARPCPGVNCSQVFLNPENTPQSMTCLECRAKYCANCLLDHPRTETCATAKKYQKNPNQRWLDQNGVKKCPNCQTDIEKNEGCKHMTCSNPECGHQFYWCCLEPYDTSVGLNHQCAHERQNAARNNNAGHQPTVMPQRHAPARGEAEAFFGAMLGGMANAFGTMRINNETQGVTGRAQWNFSRNGESIQLIARDRTDRWPLFQIAHHLITSFTQSAGEHLYLYIRDEIRFGDDHGNSFAFAEKYRSLSANQQNYLAELVREEHERQQGFHPVDRRRIGSEISDLAGLLHFFQLAAQQPRVAQTRTNTIRTTIPQGMENQIRDMIREDEEREQNIRRETSSRQMAIHEQIIRDQRRRAEEESKRMPAFPVSTRPRTATAPAPVVARPKRTVVFTAPCDVMNVNLATVMAEHIIKPQLGTLSAEDNAALGAFVGEFGRGNKEQGMTALQNLAAKINLEYKGQPLK